MIVFVVWIVVFYVKGAAHNYSDCLESKRCFEAKPETVDKTNRESIATTWKTTA